MHLELGAYEIDVLITGFPGRSLYHGALGWGTVALVRGRGRVIMLDTGGSSMRKMILTALRERELEPSDVTDVLITHAHHDHLINWTMFRRARISIGRREMDYALQVPWGETPVPEFYAQELARWPSVRLVDDGDQLLPEITAHLTPGHTPGGLVFVLHGPDHDVVFCGDAAKNRAELVSRRTDQTLDGAASTASIDLIRQLAGARPGGIIIPGHDVAMAYDSGKLRYLAKRQAAIKVWYGEDMQTVTHFDLTEK